MLDKTEIRRRLRDSLDMACIRYYLFLAGILAAIEGVMILLGPRTYGSPGKGLIFLLMLLLSAVPILIFCAWRTIRIFRAVESYHFSRTKLNAPKGGRLRDTIRFTVLVEDADGDKFPATTHSIFSTHKGFLALAMEDYINREVLVGYNEETGEVVVIG